MTAPTAHPRTQGFCPICGTRRNEQCWNFGPAPDPDDLVNIIVARAEALRTPVPASAEDLSDEENAIVEAIEAGHQI